MEFFIIIVIVFALIFILGFSCTDSAWIEFLRLSNKKDRGEILTKEENETLNELSNRRAYRD